MVVREMLKFGIPWPMILIVLLLGWTTNVAHDPVTFSEFFGAGEQTQAFLRKGLFGHHHDIERGSSLDFLANAGYALSVNSVARMTPGGLAPLGPTCSSWVVLSRSGSGRSYLCPLGWKDRPWVHAGNLMSARVALLCVLIAFAQCSFLLEQPVSSLFFRSPGWTWTIKALLANSVKVWKQRVLLGAFGGQTQKAVYLESNNHGLLLALYRPLTGLDKARFSSNMALQLVKRGISKGGRRQFTGIKAALRKSQWGPI